MKILVRNLNRDFTEDAMRKLFEPFGTIAACDLVLDKVTGKSKGFGFVEMPVDKEGWAAIKALNGKVVRDFKIRVKKSLNLSGPIKGEGEST